MSLAFDAYAESLRQAIELEKEGELEVHTGGSCHGATEALYRLHASRLKCLIAAVDRKDDERELAELEGLRLTEKHWFSKPERPSEGLRERVWSVLSDLVTALAKCRIDQAHFHRSVYRHAQALMWAPILCDPSGQRQYGSLGTVPATHSFQLRGLNYSTNAANSGLAVIVALFDKKRPQLCGVWVTSTTGASAFQTINSTVRKYDSLRGKYISAYIDSLRLCNQRTEIESFLRSALSSRRDLPSYFAASALSKGGPPGRHQTEDSLLIKVRSLSSFHFLTTVKRQANSALAAVILHEFKSRHDTSMSDDENQLKSSYACFLRLNCDPDVFVKRRLWKHNRRSSGLREVVECLISFYVRVTKEQVLPADRNDWSGESQIATLLQAALKKCGELFPNLSASFYSKKKVTKKKRKEAEPEMVKKTFDVAVPEGLTAGETFMVSILVGGQRKKVRLTVPDKPVQVMRFSLQVPAEETEDGASSKRKKSKSKT